MRMLTVAVLVTLLTLAIIPAIAGSGNNSDLIKQQKEALQSVEALDSAVTSGVTYSDYAKRRADTMAVVDRLIKDYGLSQFAQNLSDSMGWHAEAGLLWSAYLKSKDASDNFIPVTDSTVAILLKYYPDLQNCVHTVAGDKLVYLPQGLSLFWGKAKESSAAARKLLTK